MELTDADKQLIVNLIDIAWSAGACRAPQLAQQIEMLRMKILQKPAPIPTDEKKG